MDWTPILTLVIGSGATLAGIDRAGALQWKREREKWAMERNATEADVRREFERETLLQVQDQMAILARTHGEMSVAISAHFNSGQTIETYRDPPEVGERSRLANLELTKLEARILDDSVVGAVRRFHATGKFVAVQDRRALVQEMKDSNLAYHEAQDAIAGAIRRVYGGPTGGQGGGR